MRLKDLSIDPRFQGSNAPIGSKAASKTKNGVKAKSKNGGPTDTTFPKTISAARGQNVPTKTTNADTTSNALFIISADSRLTKPKAPFGTSIAERYAKSANPPPENAKRIARMNTPRAGSLANACTDVMIPDRTRKVPIIEKVNASKASRIVQFFRLSRFSVTIDE